jgi:hypothetical protein
MTDLVLRAERVLLDGDVRPAAVAIADGRIADICAVDTNYAAAEAWVPSNATLVDMPLDCDPVAVRGVGMTSVLVSDCVGLWRRTLLVEADGSRDTGTDVVWLQGTTAYVDSRGFAGTLSQSGDVFHWHRAVDLEPPGQHPDAGSMRWHDGILVETGVHADYVEHWRRDSAATMPCGALFLVAGDRHGLLMRVGPLFGWADEGEVVIDAVGGPRWNALVITVEQVQAEGVCWTVERCEGNVNP